MFSLRKLNVIRIVETEVEKNKLIDKGFKLLEEIKKDKDKIPEGIITKSDGTKNDKKGKTRK